MSNNTAATAAATLPLIVRLLMSKGILDRDHLEPIREAQSRENLPLEEILLRKRLVSEDEIAAAYAEYFLLPVHAPGDTPPQPDPRLARLIPEKLCREHLIAPVALRDDVLDVAFCAPNELLIVDELQLLTGLSVRPVIATFSVVERLLALLCNDATWSDDQLGGRTAAFEQVDDNDPNELPQDEPAEEVVHLDQPPPPGRDGRIIRFVNQIFEHAFRSGASDIHIEPFEERCRIRLRIDGWLTEIAPPHQSLYFSIVARIKVLAKMDIAEKRVPQDGSIALRSGDKRVDVRVSTVPTVHGEKVVLRVLDRNSIPLQLSDLGLDERQAADLTEAIRMPHGLMLVTGPTGSGKSTTLYACLNLLNEPGVNICTVEDPVEYKFSGINQVQVKSQIGFTFASALRSFLRQDPDIIMVGEVRDAETAQICLRAALTGHFVLSTLHTNDSLSAVNRLGDMGVEPFLLASSLRAVIAQRLIRRLCIKCRQPYPCDPLAARRYGLPPGETLYRPQGCKECRDTGYRGRVGIFEVIRVTGELAALVERRASLAELRAAASKQGMKLLSDSALEQVRQGTTSLEEALSVTISEDHRDGP